MKLPSSPLNTAIYNSLSTLGLPVYNTLPNGDMQTPCFYIGNDIPLPDNCKKEYGSLVDVRVESIIDFSRYPSWQQVDNNASNASVQLTTQPLNVIGYHVVLVNMIGGQGKLTEELSNDRIRLRRIMNFEIRLQEL